MVLFELDFYSLKNLVGPGTKVDDLYVDLTVPKRVFSIGSGKLVPNGTQCTSPVLLRLRPPRGFPLGRVHSVGWLTGCDEVVTIIIKDKVKDYDYD